MKPLTSTQISGTWGTTLLPINKDESIDFGRLSQDLDYLLTSGVDGIYTNGTAGEFYAQSEGEFDRINTLVAEKCESAAAFPNWRWLHERASLHRTGSPRRGVEARCDPGDFARLVPCELGGGKGIS